MITVTNLSKSFGGIQALDSISLHCQNGSILGLIGPNGSGKSTLVNTLTKMLAYDSGSVMMDGGFSRTFQDVRVWENMTVLENILLMTQERRPTHSLFEFRPDEFRVRSIIDHIGLSAYVDVHVRHLSYGQRKLVEIGRALANGATNLLFDEPFAGLFPEMAERVKAIIAKEKERGSSIILIEHDMSVIREVCDTVVVLDAGIVIAQGSAEDVLQDPKVVEAYLGK